jgi:hypothetical protein
MKILIYDIETRPMVVTSWGLFKPYLTHENILQESGLISAAFKWLGEKQVQATQVDPKKPADDSKCVKDLHGALSAADVIVAHNGDKFDLRKFNARAIVHGLDPLPPIPTIDTMKVARKYFSFNSNRLDYLGHFLGVGRKLHTDYGLWLEVMNGDKASLDKMVRYNKQDVLLLEKVYLKLRPYIRNHPNANLHTSGGCCPNCGGNRTQKRGFLYARTTQRQRFQCMDCKAWFAGESVRTVKIR